jgi:hypothetical protein
MTKNIFYVLIIDGRMTREPQPWIGADRVQTRGGEPIGISWVTVPPPPRPLPGERKVIWYALGYTVKPTNTFLMINELQYV